MSTEFVHLRTHSHYSLLSASLRLKALCQAVSQHGSGAVALTDDGNLFGAVEFCNIARKAGIKPILGCDLFLAAERRERGPATTAARDTAPPQRLVVLAESEAGYRSLTRLVSRSWLESSHGAPHVTAALLAEHSEGLIALAGGATGPVGSAYLRGHGEAAEADAARLRDIFGADRFFLELQDHGRPDERELNRFLLELAPRLGVDVVATNDARFLRPEDLEALRALVCIGTGTTLDDPLSEAYSPQQFLRSPAEMAAAFAEVPRALANTVAIAERCNFAITPREPLLPEFATPEGKSLDSAFREQARAGLEARLAVRAQTGLATERADYEQRLAYELDVICEMGFPGYFLIVWDVIRHAREQGIPVGPGRGSAAGSVVAWSLRITDVDPIEHELLFERFLNPERKSLPDIDIDFCQRRREEVLRYVREKYGHDRVCQIITFGALNARSVIRDVGRVLNMTYGEVDRIAKMVPEELGVTLAKALKDSPQLDELQRTDARVGRLLEIARSLEGLARNAGVHAAGVIIAPQPLTDLVPLYRTGRDEVTTQFAKDEAESVGLLKVDFLGLKTLTVLHDAIASIERAGRGQVVLEDLTLDDPQTFALFQQARTAGVFQFESSGMRDVLRKAHPTSYGDLTALNAIYRPGPLGSGMVDEYINRRHGRVPVVYPHPKLEPILKPTYGVLVFQEQVMRAAVELGGFSLGEADLLRKAMGKKKVEVMAAQEEKFLAGATLRGLPARKAQEIFALMAKFAEYGFNKSHSAAYALVAYWCAWLKTHHPAHFMAALLTADRENTVKVVRYIAECKEMGLQVLPPDVNESDVDFTAVSENQIRFGLSAIKGVGRGAVESILEPRARVGRFRTLHSFCAEIDLRLNNKKVLEALVKAGALDGLGAGRSTLMFSLDQAVEHAQAARADRESGQASLFGEPANEPAGEAAHAADLEAMPAWSQEDRLRHEKEVLGFYVSGHPLEEHAEVLASLTTAPLADLAEYGKREVTVAGIVTALRRTRTRRGDWMAFFTLEDLTGHAEVIAFPEAWKTCERAVQLDAALCVKGKVEVDDDRPKILAASIEPLGQAEQAAAQGLLVRLPEGLTSAALQETLGRADDLLSDRPGTCPVTFELPVPDVGLVRVQAGPRFRVTPERDLLDALEQVVGVGRVNLVL